MFELIDAIGRYLEYIQDHENIIPSEKYYKAIASWSEELKTLANMESRLEARNGYD